MADLRTSLLSHVTRGSPSQIWQCYRCNIFAPVLSQLWCINTRERAAHGRYEHCNPAGVVSESHSLTMLAAF